MSRHWRSNPLGELLYLPMSLMMSLGVVRPDPDMEWPDESQPEPAWSGLRFCKECNTGTLHVEHWWAIEAESTTECTACGGVWMTA